MNLEREGRWNKDWVVLFGGGGGPGAWGNFFFFFIPLFHFIK